MNMKLATSAASKPAARTQLRETPESIRRKRVPLRDDGIGPADVGTNPMCSRWFQSGCVFSPVSEELLSSWQALDANSANSRALRKKGDSQAMVRILLVEDEPLVRELALEDLSDAGFDVVAARDGDEALEIAQADRSFDLIFTDIKMPSAIDGWDLAEQVKQLIPGIKVIFATGLSDDFGRVGPDDRLLQKPYRRETLLGALAEIGLSAG